MRRHHWKRYLFVVTTLFTLFPNLHPLKAEWPDRRAEIVDRHELMRADGFDHGWFGHEGPGAFPDAWDADRRRGLPPYPEHQSWAIGCQEANQHYAYIQGQPQLAGSPQLERAAARAGDCALQAQGIAPGTPTYQTDRVIEGLYGRLLCRPADAGGLSYWTSVLQSGGIQAVIQGIQSSPEYQQKVASGACH